MSKVKERHKRNLHQFLQTVVQAIIVLNAGVLMWDNTSMDIIVQVLMILQI